jgi:hypothetical protein
LHKKDCRNVNDSDDSGKFVCDSGSYSATARELNTVASMAAFITFGGKPIVASVAQMMSISIVKNMMPVIGLRVVF